MVFSRLDICQATRRKQSGHLVSTYSASDLKEVGVL